VHREYGNKFLECYLIKDVASDTYIAGLAAPFDVECLFSYYLTIFTTKTREHHSAGVGLIDHWTRRCMDRGVKYQNLGAIYKKGNDRTWKGFSNFKLKLNPTIHTYDITRVRFTYKYEKES
jgi:hypothetical protein